VSIANESKDLGQLRASEAGTGFVIRFTPRAGQSRG